MKSGVKMGVMNYLRILIFHSIIASYLKHKAVHDWCYRESVLGEVELSDLKLPRTVHMVSRTFQ